MTVAEVIIVGGGIAGVSLAGRLAGHARVILLEREDMLATHTTGRSAAVFSEAYGNELVRNWTRASRGFYANPPEGFAQRPLVTPRPTLFVANPEFAPSLERLLSQNAQTVRALTALEARMLMPVLREGVFTAFCEEPESADIDVHGLFDGFRRMALHGGVEILTRQKVTGIDRDANDWTVTTTTGRFSAPIVVNAAGAWAGKIGELARLGDRHLTPLRRTAVTIEPPPGVDISGWMHVNDIGGSFYFKPDAGLILASPMDETPSEPCDAQPEEIDVALIASRIEEATTLKVQRIRRRWAGLRTFTPDRTPVFEFDREAEGFFWLVGQGGYGMQTAPAISACAAACVLERLSRRSV